MKTPLQIVMRHIEHSGALEERIREHVARLESFHPHIVSCRVLVEPLRRHDRHGRAFQVRIDVRVPGKDYIATRRDDVDVFLALHEAYHAARRQLEDDIRQKRGEVKQHAPRPAPEENGA
jgi:ribosome-associated translation inhibitor RaiA